MTLTREDPHALVPQVTAARRTTGCAVLLTVAVAGVVVRLGDEAVAQVRDWGVSHHTLEIWTLPAEVLVVLAPALWVISSARALGRVLRRYRVAADQEAQLEDPRRAAAVPPLATHLIQPQRTSAASASRTMMVTALLALTAAAIGLGLGPDDWSGALPDQARTGAWLAALALAMVSLAALRTLRSARRRTAVERLSSADLGTARPSRPQPAAAVPPLSVRFAGPLRPVPRKGAAPHLLYLRLFDNQAGTQSFVARWRRFGIVHYLRSADEIGAAELRALRAGGDALLIDDDADLEQFLQRAGPDPDGRRHCVQGLLCHDSYWQRAVIRLLQQVDLVVLDLTGFHPGHSGTAFELQAALDLVDVSRLRLLAAASSDQKYLAAQLRSAWAGMAAGSPNAGSDARTVTVNLG